MERDTDDRVLVATYPYKVWATEKVSCSACNTCLRVPGSQRCIYGGPFNFGRERDGLPT